MDQGFVVLIGEINKVDRLISGSALTILENGPKLYSLIEAKFMNLLILMCVIIFNCFPLSGT